MDSKNVIIRTDASPNIGGGHVMRCMTLADYLHKLGWTCVFKIGHQTLETVPALEQSDHHTEILDANNVFNPEALAMSDDREIDLIIIDHYDIGINYEQKCRALAKRIFVFDDLANRVHDCDILLDQTFGRLSEEYKTLVPNTCQVLTGSKYILLRPQFFEKRKESLAARRERNTINRVFISIGMTDFDNVTSRALQGIEQYPMDLSVDVVLGPTAPHLEKVQRQASKMSQSVQVHIGVDDIASLLASADIAIGAGGSAAWERCCLGLPTLTFYTADNQARVIKELASFGAIEELQLDGISEPDQIAERLKYFSSNKDSFKKMSDIAAKVCDGKGPERLVAEAALF